MINERRKITAKLHSFLYVASIMQLFEEARVFRAHSTYAGWQACDTVIETFVLELPLHFDFGVSTLFEVTKFRQTVL